MKAMTTATAACILFLLGTAGAQQTEPPEEPSEEQGRQGIPATPHQEQAAREIGGDLFKRLDKDHDGSITREEAQAESSLSGNWSRYDRNGDQMLDPKEFSAFDKSAAEGEDPQVGQRGRTEAGMPATPHQEHAIRGDLIERLDRNGDGGISQQEAQGEARLTADWDRLDRNDDGKLDPSELDRFEQ